MSPSLQGLQIVTHVSYAFNIHAHAKSSYKLQHVFFINLKDTAEESKQKNN